MQNYTVSKIAQIIDGKIATSVDHEIKYLSIDSRTIASPKETLFFALVGDRHNGHYYLTDLYKYGVRCFVVNATPTNKELFLEAAFIIVNNTLTALQQLCAFHRNLFNIPIIGITGSNGKTIVKEWLYQLLQEDKNITRSPKSYNSQVGVPLSVWLLENETELGVFEAGISKNREMKNLQIIINPTIGIFTTIGDAHQENFESYAQKITEKLKLFTKVETLIYCKDHELIDLEIIKCDFLTKKKLFSWSTKQNANLQITQIEKTHTQTNITAIYNKETINITIPFTDHASVENAIHCWSYLLYIKYSSAVISKRMLALHPVAMRLELKEGINNCTIINDSYNSDLGSIIIAIDFLNQQQQHPTKTIILSDILQSSNDETTLYSQVAELLKKKNIHQIIGIGDAISKYSHLFSIKKQFFANTNQFIQHIPELKLHNQVVLLKGARKFEFEKISTLLQQKVHETVLEINLNAIVHNLNYFKSLIKPETKIMAMVKAFSYGSGIFEIANLLQFQRVDYLTVAFADEGIELRKSGITLPIMVMNPEEQSFDLMLEYQIEPEIYSFRVLNLFKKALIRNSIKAYPAHIKLDTGMKRLGFVEEEIPQLLLDLKENNNIIIRSIFSHLAASDEDIHDKFTQMQIDRFEKMSTQLMNSFDYPILRHILNSSGIERFPNAQYNMVRLGIGMYGISAKHQEKLQNVSTLKTVISQIKIVGENETIGYSRKGILKAGSKIATIPIGYADGLNRRLGNNTGKVFINGKLAPIIGSICMDMCMIDITDIDAKEGDIVTIFGENYPISKLAKQIGTISYEILTGISRRVKRVYFQE